MLPAAVPTQTGRVYHEKIISHTHPPASVLSVMQYTGLHKEEMFARQSALSVNMYIQHEASGTATFSLLTVWGGGEPHAQNIRKQNTVLQEGLSLALLSPGSESY